MKFSTFLAKNVNNAATVKAVFPEKNMTAVGHPVDFLKGEISMLNANIFDYMITDPAVGYNVIIWLTRTNDTMCEVI